jgi:hypothetical protein
VVSSVFGIQVAAGINVQTVSQKSWKFEGDTLTVFPNGKFVIDSEGTRLWDIASHQKAAKEYLRMIVNRIAQGQLVQARQDLQNLIRNYSQTSAAREAADRLKNPDLQPTPLEVMPDGSLRLN